MYLDLWVTHDIYYGINTATLEHRKLVYESEIDRYLRREGWRVVHAPWTWVKWSVQGCPVAANAYVGIRVRTGTGNQCLQIGPCPAYKVDWTDPNIVAYIPIIAGEDYSHVKWDGNFKI